MEQKQKSVKSAIYVSLFILIALASASSATDITVTRQAPATAMKGSSITINLTLNVDEARNLTTAGLKEYIPDGLTVSNAGGGNKDDAGTMIEWILIEESAYDLYEELNEYIDLGLKVMEDQTISYRVKVPVEYAGSTITFEDLNISVSNATYTTSFSGDSEIALSGILGDIREPVGIGIEDLEALAEAYGSTPSSQNWNPDADLSGISGMDTDQSVGIEDLEILAENY